MAPGRAGVAAAGRGSDQAFEDEHAEEAEGGEHRPLEDDQAPLAVAGLAGADVEGKAHAGGEQQQHDGPAEQQHGRGVAGGGLEGWRLTRPGLAGRSRRGLRGPARS